MKIISELSLSMCVISVVSMILNCILPENKGFKQVLKLVCGILLATVVINSIMLMINSNFKYDQFIYDESYAKEIEQYMVEKSTSAYLLDVEKETKDIFRKYHTDCIKIANDEDRLIFYIKNEGVSVEELTDELNKITKVNCFVMAGDECE